MVKQIDLVYSIELTHLQLSGSEDSLYADLYINAMKVRT